MTLFRGTPLLVQLFLVYYGLGSLRPFWQELNLWWGALPPGGLIVMDDISQWAAEYDRTGLGGSHRAALEFCQTTAANSVLINGNFGRATTNPMIYTDVCGFGLLQKPY